MQCQSKRDSHVTMLDPITSLKMTILIREVWASDKQIVIHSCHYCSQLDRIHWLQIKGAQPKATEIVNTLAEWKTMGVGNLDYPIKAVI